MSHAASPTFDPGSAFPHVDRISVLAIRFLVASQSLAAIARLPAQLPRDRASDESRCYLMVLSIGAANETAIAFQEADAVGVFAELDATSWKDPKARLARLRGDVNHNDPTSLRELLIRTTRNKIGFHWDADFVMESLRELAGSAVPAWDGGKSHSVADTTIPLVSALITRSLERIAGSKRDLDALITRIAQFQGDCFHVAHSAFALSLKRAGIGLDGA